LSTAGYEIQRALGDPTTEYQTVWESSAGGVAYLQEPSSKYCSAAWLISAANSHKKGFFLQTPGDGGKLEWSFGASVITRTGKKKAFKGVLVNSDPGSIHPLPFSLQIPDEWESTDLPLIIVPVTLLRLHVDQTSAALTGLIVRVEGVERDVRDSSADTDFDSLIRVLHTCDADLIKLERRWNFEKKLVTEVLKIIYKYRQPQSNYQEIGFYNCTICPADRAAINFLLSNSSPDRTDTPGVYSTKPFKVLDSFVTLQEQRCRASEYDLGVLPRRISNQFTAVSMTASTSFIL
jgi:hypothetical protein